MNGLTAAPLFGTFMAFVAAVGELFGAEQARLSAEEWLEELASRDRHSQSDFRDWRSCDYRGVGASSGSVDPLKTRT
jgi:hypothetical protein